MKWSTKTSQRRTGFRPVCDRLETRELLSSMVGHMPTAKPMAATVSAMQTTHRSFLASLGTPKVFTTVPANGDLNPYGVAAYHKGWLVSNFNNSNNLQGTGSTVVRIDSTGQTSTFATLPGQPGLTTALGVLSAGFIIVGSLPTTDGTSATVQPGGLFVLNRNGKTVATFSDPNLLDGPWDLTISDHGNHAQIYVSNVLNGTVTRIDLSIRHNQLVTSAVQIASGYVARTDPAALVIGPTGLAYNARTDTLYVASTGDNAIFAIPHASKAGTQSGTGTLIYKDDVHLHGPLGLVQLPNGDLLTSNGDAVNPDPNNPSTLVEFTPRGQFVDQLSLAPTPGAAFGLAVRVAGNKASLAAVNDADNTLEVFTTNR
jgi:hypothetical protein